MIVNVGTKRITSAPNQAYYFSTDKPCGTENVNPGVMSYIKYHYFTCVIIILTLRSLS